MTEERVERMKNNILKSLQINRTKKFLMEDLASLYENWECQERQVKWVIHGQRVYDFFGYDWQLPFWDIELANFYKKVPFCLKLNQKLYKLWLEKWNYNNLFKNFNPTVWRWPGYTLATVPTAKFIEILLGQEAKQKWYELFFYWGHSSEHFAPYKYFEYYKVRNKIRNSISLNIRNWVFENNVPYNLFDD